MSSSRAGKKRLTRSRDLSRGDRVFVALGEHAGKRGRVGYVGPVEFAEGRWVGVVVDAGAGAGKNDGSVQGKRYFECPGGERRGLFLKAGMLRPEPTDAEEPDRGGRHYEEEDDGHARTYYDEEEEELVPEEEEEEEEEEDLRDDRPHAAQRAGRAGGGSRARPRQAAAGRVNVRANPRAAVAKAVSLDSLGRDAAARAASARHAAGGGHADAASTTSAHSRATGGGGGGGSRPTSRNSTLNSSGGGGKKKGRTKSPGARSARNEARVAVASLRAQEELSSGSMLGTAAVDLATGDDLAAMNRQNNRQGLVPDEVRTRALADERHAHRDLPSDDEEVAAVDDFIEVIESGSGPRAGTPRLGHPRRLPRGTRLVVLGLCGTLVDDRVTAGRQPLIGVACTAALKAFGVHIFPEDVQKHAGRLPYDTLLTLLREHGAIHSEEWYEREARDCLQAFERSYSTQLMGIERELRGATETLRALCARGVRVAVATSYPRSMVEYALDAFGWRDDAALADVMWMSHWEDVAGGGGGRPSPRFIERAMGEFGVRNREHVVAVGSTRAHVAEGKAAGVWTVAVMGAALTDAAAKSVERARPTYFVGSVDELLALLPAEEAAGA